MRIPTALVPAAAVIRRDAIVLSTYRTAFLTVFFAPAVTLVLFYYVSRLVRAGQFSDPDAYFAFVLVGTLTLQILIPLVTAPPTQVRQELVAGTFERLLISPLGATGGLAALMLFPSCVAMAMSIVMVLLGVVVFGLELDWSTAALALPVMLLSTVAFAPFGFLLSAVVLRYKHGAGLGRYLLAGITLTAGMYYPTSLLPDWIEWVSEVQPFAPSVQLMRHVLLGTAVQEDPWLLVLRLVGFAAGMLPLTVAVISVAAAASRKRGTMLEF